MPTRCTSRLSVDAVPGGGRRVRRADRQHLRRRAADLSRDRGAGRQILAAAASTSTSAPTACCWRRSCRGLRPSSRLFINVHLDGMEATHDRLVERRGRVRRGRRAASSAAKARRLPGLHQHDDLPRNRHARDRRAVRLPHRAGRRRVHDLAGLRLRRRCSEADPQGAPSIFMTRDEVHEKFREARAAAAAVPADRLADLPGISLRRARAGLRGLGQSDVQRPRLARPVLPAGRRPLRDLSRTGRGDRLGHVRSRRRSALRALPGPLRLRAGRRLRRAARPPRRAEDGRVADDVMP